MGLGEKAPIAGFDRHRVGPPAAGGKEQAEPAVEDVIARDLPCVQPLPLAAVNLAILGKDIVRQREATGGEGLAQRPAFGLGEVQQGVVDIQQQLADHAWALRASSLARAAKLSRERVSPRIVGAKPQASKTPAISALL